MKKRLFLAVLAVAVLAPGCKTFGRVVDVIDWTGGAISATADILRATGEDIADAWGATGDPVLDGLGLKPAPGPEAPVDPAE